MEMQDTGAEKEGDPGGLGHGGNGPGQRGPAPSALPAPAKAIKHTSAIKKGGGKELGQLTSMAFPEELCPIERGMLVWFKFQNHPFWPPPPEG